MDDTIPHLQRARRRQAIIESMRNQVFLGGASGATDWRARIAIPLLEEAGVSYFNPQLSPGEWAPEFEAAEMLAKDGSDVLLFVLNGQTRGVATVAEIAYYMGIGRTLSLSIVDIEEGDGIDGAPVGARERDDLNRGRIFLRTMAAQQGIPVFTECRDAVSHAIALALAARQALTKDDLHSILSELRFGEHEFLAEEIDNGYLLRISGIEQDSETGRRERFLGRDWFIGRSASRSDVVRTALKAVLTWQEHEVRERFTYKGRNLFSPHFNIDRLSRLFIR